MVGVYHVHHRVLVNGCTRTKAQHQQGSRHPQPAKRWQRAAWKAARLRPPRPCNAPRTFANHPRIHALKAQPLSSQRAAAVPRLPERLEKLELKHVSDHDPQRRRMEHWAPKLVPPPAHPGDTHTRSNARASLSTKHCLNEQVSYQHETCDRRQPACERVVTYNTPANAVTLQGPGPHSRQPAGTTHAGRRTYTYVDTAWDAHAISARQNTAPNTRTQGHSQGSQPACSHSRHTLHFMCVSHPLRCTPSLRAVAPHNLHHATKEEQDPKKAGSHDSHQQHHHKQQVRRAEVPAAQPGGVQPALGAGPSAR
jgi:hypothetical protein